MNRTPKPDAPRSSGIQALSLRERWSGGDSPPLGFRYPETGEGAARGRRRVSLLAFFSVLSIAPLAHARPAPPPPDAFLNPPPDRAVIAAAVERALVFLAREQRADGSFAPKDAPNRLATTGLAVLAYLSAGEPPGDGRFGQTVARAVDYLVAQTPESGYPGGVDGSRMYGQGIVTAALASALGAEPDPDRRTRIRAALARCIAVILKAQAVAKDPKFAGGWRYEPAATDADLSATGWCAMALRAAAAAGVDVPRESFANAVKFVLACRTPSGGFAYQPGEGARLGSTAAGALTLLLLAGDPLPPELPAALDYLAAHPPTFEQKFPHYTYYYTLHAAFHARDQSPEPARDALIAPLLRDLLARQQPDGGLPPSTDPQEPGRIYATTMTVLSLTLPWQVLPAYQR